MILGSRNVLASSELYELKKSMVSETLGSSFLDRWLRTQPLRKYAALFTLMKTLKAPLLAPVFPRLILLAMTICQPLLLRELLDHLSKTTDARDANKARGIVAAYALVFLGTAVSSGYFWYKNYQFLAMVRGCLVSIICWKSTRLDILAVEDPKAAVTLMSADVERIMDGIRALHDIWAYTIQIAVALYLLQSQIGTAFVVPVVVCLICGLTTAWVSRIMNRRQVVWMEAIQERIGLTSAVLSSIKQVKMRGFMSIFSHSIYDHRKRELQAANGWRWNLLHTVCLSFLPEYLVPSFTFAVYVIQARVRGVDFDASRAFTTLSLLTIITQPINGVIQSIPSMVGAVGCLARIQDFLNNADQRDFRDHVEAISLQDESHDASQHSTDIELQTFQQSQNSSGDLLFEIVSGTFGWGTDKVVLSDLNLRIPARSMTCIVGPVASGKSTLCHALLGETTAFKGQTKVSGDPRGIAFCSQTPWLINGTLKDNITLFASFEEAWYNTVLRACALTEDIANMRKKDDTAIGSDGISLSGGQRHKVALARALYARKPVLILDDIFSGFDPGSTESVFHEVLGPSGLARRLNMTVILATHTIKFLPFADHVIVLGPEPQEGGYAYLRTIPGYVKDLAINEVTQEVKSCEETVPTAELEDDKSMVNASGADLARRTGEFAIYRYYFGSAGPVTVAWTVVAIVATASLLNFSVYWVKLWTDASTTEAHPNHNKYVGMYTLFQFLSLLLLQTGAYGVIIQLATKTGMTLHNRLLSTVAKATLSFFTTTDVGVITNHFSQDMQLIDTHLPLGVVNLLFNLCAAIGQGVLIILAAPWVGLAFPVMLALLYLIQKFYLQTSRQLRLLDLEAKSPLYTNFLESLNGLATIRAFGWQNSNIALNARLLDESQRPLYLLYMVQRWLQFVLDVVVAFVAVIVASLALFMQSNGPGSAGVALTQVLMMSISLKGIILSWTEVETCIGSVSRIKGFEDLTPTETEPQHPTDPGSDWPRNGKIDVNEATAAYDTALEDPVLKSLTLDIKPGEKIGICGRSGSGKSSLVLALLHLIETQNGSISIDGYDLRQVSREVLRKSVNVIPQESIFLPLKVRAVLDPFGTSSVAEMVKALKKVELWPLFERSGGLDSELKKDDLSYGQRQLFSLAGATLRKSKVVILDEATSK